MGRGFGFLLYLILFIPLIIEKMFLSVETRVVGSVCLFSLFCFVLIVFICCYLLVSLLFKHAS